MAATELDPIFVRALKLLHSRSKDALEQLKQMTDEAIAQRRGELALKKMEESGYADEGKYSYKSKRDYSEVDRRRDAEKKSLERLKDDLAFLTEDPIPAKKPKLELSSSETKTSSWKERESKERDHSRDTSTKEKSSSSHRDSRRDHGDTHKPSIKEDPSWLDSGRDVIVISRSKKSEVDPPPEKKLVISGNRVDSDSSEENDHAATFSGLDEEQFASDMMEISCVVCKEFDITSGNRLLDCQECHRLYHQECHRPPVEEDVDDPRFVWYCSKCSKNMKKMVKAQKPKTSQSSSSSSKEREAPAPPKAFKPEASLQPFKRLDTSKSGGGKESSSSSGSSASRPYTGLASLAANLSSKTHAEASSKSSREPAKASAAAPSSKVDHSKGLGFLFKPDAHKITTMSSQKSSSSSSDKSGLYKLGSSGSGKSSSNMKSSTSGSSSSNSNKTPSISVLGKSSSSSSTSSTSSSSSKPSSSSQPRSSSTSTPTTSSTIKMSTLMNADKKVQMMKKKAAARAAERKLR